MGRCRVVQPDLVRLPLSDDDWIEVKRELNAGETRQIQIRMMAQTSITPGERVGLDPAKVGLTQALEYLVAWSLVDAQGRPLEISEGALNLIDYDSQQEIITAIEAHDADVRERRERDRKNRRGAMSSAVIS